MLMSLALVTIVYFSIDIINLKHTLYIFDNIANILFSIHISAYGYPTLREGVHSSVSSHLIIY